MSEKVYVNICDTKKCPGPVYAVKTGDTLYSIAQRHHCRVRTLLDLNPFVDIYICSRVRKSVYQTAGDRGK